MLQVRLLAGALPGNDLRQVVDTCVSVNQAVYNLVPVKGR